MAVTWSPGKLIVDSKDEARSFFFEARDQFLSAFAEHKRLNDREQLALLQMKADIDTESDNETIRVAILRLHKSFGSPGNWGYGNPKGVSLCRLYDVYGLLRAPAKEAS